MNIDNKIKCKNNAFLFSSCAVANGIMYFNTENENIPMLMNLSDNKVSYMNLGKEYNYFLKGTDKMLVAGDEVYFLELYGDYLISYNIKTKLFQKFYIECHKYDWGNFVSFTQYKSYLYIFPRCYEAVVKLDLKTGTINKNTQLYTAIKENNYSKERKEPFTLFLGSCLVNNVMWLFRNEGNLVIAYDMHTDSFQEYFLPQDIGGVVQAVWQHDLFYLLSGKGQIYIWNIHNNDLRLMSAYRESKIYNGIFRRMVITDMNLWLIPTSGEDIYIISLSNEKVEKYQDYPMNFAYCPDAPSKYCEYCEDHENYYFAMRSGNYSLCINKKTGMANWIKPVLPTRQERYEFYVMNSCFMNEERYPLDDYIMDVQQYGRKVDVLQQEKVGRKIWNHLRNI